MCNKCLGTKQYWNGEEMVDCDCSDPDGYIDDIIDLDEDLDDNGRSYYDEDAY